MSKKKNILSEILRFFPEHINFICSDMKCRKKLSREDKRMINKITSYLETRPRGRPPKVPEHIEFMLRESVG